MHAFDSQDDPRSPSARLSTARDTLLEASERALKVSPVWNADEVLYMHGANVRMGPAGNKKLLNGRDVSAR